MQIKLEHLTKRFGDTVAVNDLSITLESGKLIALLGPSGCGKTTTLNMISGILPVSGGSIFFDDRDVTSLPPEKRGIGLVFQNYALYPHMTVLQNICFPMEIQRIPKKERIRRAEELAEMVHITPYLKRKPAELSGGFGNVFQFIIRQGANERIQRPIRGVMHEIRNACTAPFT